MDMIVKFWLKITRHTSAFLYRKLSLRAQLLKINLTPLVSYVWNHSNEIYL